MNEIIKLLLKVQSQSLALLKRDRQVLFLALIPVVFGIALYFIVGGKIFFELKEFGEKNILNYFSNQTLGGAFYGILLTLFFVVALLVTHWTILSVIGLLGFYFFEKISSIVEHDVLLTKFPNKVKQIKELPFWQAFKGQVKKAVFLIFFAIATFLLTFFPFFAPIHFLLVLLVLAMQFLDYSWERVGWSWRPCFNDVEKHFIYYLLAGFVFSILLVIPLINIIAFPYGVIFFSYLWCELNLAKVLEENS